EASRSALATSAWRHAVRALEKAGQFDETLATALMDDLRVEVRISAARWLGRALGPAATPLLGQALEMRRWSSDTLRWEGDPGATDPWDEPLFPAPPWELRGTFVET